MENSATRNNTPELHSVTAIELDQMRLGPIKWIVPGVLPTGVAVLAAPPKYFKSYMALGLCVAVCDGRRYLGFDTVKSEALYFDLESSLRRPKSRLDQILGKNQRRPEGLHIIPGTEPVKRLGVGFEEQLEQQINKLPDVRIVVIDVFQKIRSPQGRKGMYAHDYDDIGPLVNIAMRHGVCILLITHTTKMKHEDILNEIAGSTGILAASDTALVITKEKRQDSNAILTVTGRDIESIDLAMEFDKRFYRWEPIGTTEEIRERKRLEAYNDNNVIRTIKQLLKDHGGVWEGSASEIRNYGILHNLPIHEDPAQLGKTIGEYEELLMLDHILYDYKVSNGKRRYIIKDSTVLTVLPFNKH